MSSFRAFVALGTLVTIASSPQDPPKKYDLSISWKGVPGSTGRYSVESTRKTSSMMQRDDREPDCTETRLEDRLKGAWTVQEAGGDIEARIRWTFSEALGERDGKRTGYGFPNKAIVEVSKKDERTFSFENGEELAADDLKGLHYFTPRKWFQGRSPELQLIRPKRSVAVGEKWDLDVEALGGEYITSQVTWDRKKSTGSGLLVSVENRKGSEFAVLEIGAAFHVTKFGDMSLDPAMTLRITGHIDLCIDGTRPDARIIRSLEMGGWTSEKLKDGITTLHTRLKLDFKCKMEITSSK